MLGVSGIVVQLIGDTLRWWRLTFRSTQSLKAENLFLRPQLALYVEQGMKPRRIDPGVPDPPPACRDYQNASSRHRHGESYAVRANRSSADCITNTPSRLAARD